MNCFAFDIETVPDVEFGKALYGLDGLSDEDAAQAMMNKRMQATGSDFLPLHQQRVVAISVAYRSKSGFRVWTLGDENASEKEIVSRFFDGLARFSPDLISWNGSGFDLPVLHYRAMKHGIDASRY
ncbi:MAG: ribonuclease H-like domain-containing protein, partial [Chromatiales bacterium]|nr:ribonuclease H-like domain-containing protein [Chromatiales bacterium]